MVSEPAADALELRHVPYDHPDAIALVADAQNFYIALYGGPDETPFRPEEFAPPHGAFLVGYLAGEPVATGAWRFSDAGVPATAQRPAEIKRMFVRESLRQRGLGQQVLAALEADAAASGADWMILETGQPQVAAVALYRAAGYRPIKSFGYYAGSDLVVNLGKSLRRRAD
jgi:GNAT superfamily N-acetyltransferase